MSCHSPIVVHIPCCTAFLTHFAQRTGPSPRGIWRGRSGRRWWANRTSSAQLGRTHRCRCQQDDARYLWDVHNPTLSWELWLYAIVISCYIMLYPYYIKLYPCYIHIISILYPYYPAIIDITIYNITYPLSSSTQSTMIFSPVARCWSCTQSGHRVAWGALCLCWGPWEGPNGQPMASNGQINSSNMPLQIISSNNMIITCNFKPLLYIYYVYIYIYILCIYIYYIYILCIYI